LSVHEKVEIIRVLVRGEKTYVCKKIQLIIVNSFDFVEEQRPNFIYVHEESHYEQKDEKM
jgi:hypothetical protein